MKINEIAKKLHELYERDEFVLDNYEELEKFLSLDITERQGYPDRMRDEMEDDEEWHEEN